MKRVASKLLALFILMTLAVVLYISLAKVYPFNWKSVIRYYRLFISGLTTTLIVSFASLGFSLLIGFLVAIARTSRTYLSRDLATLYVWFFRNMPLLVIILLIYYGIGSIIYIDRFWAGALSLAMFEGAYVGEILRAGIEAVPKGEVEAGKAMGLYNGQITWSIIFPTAFRISIPSLIGQLISLVKDSSLVSVIALGDLTMKARQVGTQTFASLEAYLILAGFYLAITSLLSILGRYLERRFQLK